MIEITAEIYQFLSRDNISDQDLAEYNASPAQRPDIWAYGSYKITKKPFELAFSQPFPARPSIGAHQYVDEIVDYYLEQRWPKCITGKIRISVNKEDLKDPTTVKNLLTFLRLNIWKLRDQNNMLAEMVDQFARVKGYRREFFNMQLFDIVGSRRPSASRNYVQTPVGEYIGPGVAYIKNIDPLNMPNELVWSQIVPFPEPTDLKNDLSDLEKRITEIQRHNNSYNELRDAKHYLHEGDVKASIRSASTAVEVILEYYCRLWGITMPREKVPFDEKIEKILAKGSRPSFKAADPNTATRLRYLYRTSSKTRHEGDCYYIDDSGTKVLVRTVELSEKFLEAAEKFTLWMDSLV